MSSRASKILTTKTKPAELKISTMRKMMKAAKSTSMVNMETSGLREHLPSRVVTKMENLPKVVRRNRVTSTTSTSLITIMLGMGTLEKRSSVEAGLYMVLIMVLMHTALWDTKRTASSTNTCLFIRKG